jgi:hypothetical protein
LLILRGSGECYVFGFVECIDIILKRLCGSCLIVCRDSWSFMGDLDWKHGFYAVD